MNITKQENQAILSEVDLDLSNHSLPILSSLRNWARNTVLGTSLTLLPAISGCSHSMLASDPSASQAKPNPDSGVSKRSMLDKTITRVLERQDAQVDIDNMLADGRATLTYFEHNRDQHPIIIAQSARVDEAPGARDAEWAKGKTLYVPLSLEAHRADLDSAYANKTHISGEGESAVYQMTFPLYFNSESLREFAAKKVNALYGEAFVKDCQFVILPYSYIAITGKLNGREFLLGQWPEFDSASVNIPKPSSLPTETPITITGTEKELELVQKEMRFEAEFVRGGITFQQNAVNLIFDHLDHRLLKEKLFGDAQNERSAKQSILDGGAIIDLGPVNIGSTASEGELKVSRRIAVDRDFFNRYIQDVATRIGVSIHLETDNNMDRLNALTDIILEKLFEQYDVVRVSFNENGAVVDKELLVGDLSASDITRIENSAQGSRGIAVEDAISYSDPATATGGAAVSGSKAKDKKDNPAPTGSVSGHKKRSYNSSGTNQAEFVERSKDPKSVDLVILDSRDLRSESQGTFAQSNYEHVNGHYVQQGTVINYIPPVIETQILEVPVDWSTIPKIAGDGELDSQKNKTIAHRLSIRDFQVDEKDPSSASLLVEYRIEEVGKDTVLGRSERVTVKTRDGKPIIALALSTDENGNARNFPVRDFDHYWEWHEKYHGKSFPGYNDPRESRAAAPDNPPVNEGTYYRAGYVTSDGKGSDDKGPASLHISIGVAVDVLIEKGYEDIDHNR